MKFAAKFSGFAANAKIFSLTAGPSTWHIHTYRHRKNIFLEFKKRNIFIPTRRRRIKAGFK